MGALIPAPAALGGRAGFFTRALGDEPDRAQAARLLGLPAGVAVIAPKQVHGARCLALTAAPSPADVAPAEADAIAARGADVACAVVAADCLPVLCADAGAGVIAAAHAGWRGLLAGVLEATLEAMAGLGAREGHVVCAFGPAIRQRHYEVGEDFRQAFLARDPRARAFFRKPPGAARPWFDLPGYARARLARKGAVCVDGGLSTFDDAARFYSYRRGDRRRRQLALIGPVVGARA